MGFEFDPKKSILNKEKHGINFVETQALWENPAVRLPSKKKGEPRELAIGIIGMDYWTVILTERNEKIRIISCRRSRDEEKKIYQKRIN